MPALPSTLALTTIQTSQQILSADHRNNYSAIQTGWNSLIGILDDGVTGDVLTGVGSTIAYAKPPGYEYAYNEFTSQVSVTATTVGTANTVVTASAVTFDGATVVIIEFYATYISRGTTAIHVELYEDGTSLGQLAFAGQVQVPLGSARRRRTPAVGSRTYSVRAWVDAGTGAVTGGAGGSGGGVDLPGFIRITKV